MHDNDVITFGYSEKISKYHKISSTRISLQYDNTVESLYDGHTIRTHYKVDKNSAPTTKSNLYKADTFIKWILFYGPNGVRFRDIPLYNFN